MGGPKVGETKLFKYQVIKSSRREIAGGPEVLGEKKPVFLEMGRMEEGIRRLGRLASSSSLSLDR